MSFYLNEVSLHQQYYSSQDFRQALSVVIRCREAIQNSNFQFYCCDHLRIAQVTPTTTFHDEVNRLERPQKIQVLRFFDRANNWLLAQEHNPDDEFKWNELDVTNTSVAEAAFRSYIGEECALISFAPSHCCSSPLSISWETLTDEARTLTIGNCWAEATVEGELQRRLQAGRQRELQSWAELIEWGQNYCPNLYFADYLLQRLRGVPFTPAVARQVQRRLEVLNTLRQETDEHGARSIAGQELYDQYFVGGDPWFTDESTTNKVDFARELTFPHPQRPGETLFCPWHGKVRTQVFRIHFSWPLVPQQTHIYIVHIGPKITRD
jgi:hypothetical protein